MSSELIWKSDALACVNEAFMTQTYKAIEAIPTVDAIERKRGEWRIVGQYKDRSGRIVDRLECSECNAVEHRDIGERLPNFCKWCGSDNRPRGNNNE